MNVQPLADTVELGRGQHTNWRATDDVVDMTVPAVAPVIAHLNSEPQALRLDLTRTAMVVIDMQNDFCAPQGWVHGLGAPLEPTRKPIGPLRALLPKLRENSVPVIWVNWGNRPDLANMPPNQLHMFNQNGKGVGLGDPLPSNGAPVLQKDSWAAEVVDELKPEPGDHRVDKHRISGFWDTPLDSILRNLGIRTVLFAGVNTDQCVLHTLTDANFLGYGCVMVDDCCGTGSPDYCTEAVVWNVKRVFGFVAGSKDVIAALPK